MTESRPIISDWQARQLLEIARDFYADPKNQAAYEAWKAEKEKRKREEADGCEEKQAQQAPGSCG